MKKSLTYAIATLFLCFSVAFMAYFALTPVVTAKEGVVYYLQPRTSPATFASELSQQSTISHSFILTIYAYFHPQAPLKTGEYFFPKGSTLFSIWKQVTMGSGFYYHRFTIIPGWSFHQFRQALEQTNNLQHTITSLSDAEIMTKLGESTLSPEGEFFPETYYYTRNEADWVLVKQAFQLMQKQLQLAWEKRSAELPYNTPYEALIAASLIEKEAYLDRERPIIAGVLVNRLRKHMLLQFDPTVVYGMGDNYRGKIHKSDLRTDTLYNTYIHKGLPPTPIAMPGLISLMAAVNPNVHDYLYFVAKGDGSHQFSKTLSEHEAAIKRAMKPTGYLDSNRFQQLIYPYYSRESQWKLDHLTSNQ